MLAPVGRRSCVGVHSWLVAVGILQQGEQPINLGEVLLLSLLDSCMNQIVAEHVLGIDAVHAYQAVVVSTPLFTQPIRVPMSPLVECLTIQEEVTERLVQQCGPGLKQAQCAKEDRVIDMV